MTTNGTSPSTIRVLLVEDRIPDAALGSGYPRMIDTIAELQQLVGATSRSIRPSESVRARAHISLLAWS